MIMHSMIIRFIMIVLIKIYIKGILIGVLKEK
jgi:hypothetical protein